MLLFSTFFLFTSFLKPVLWEFLFQWILISFYNTKIHSIVPVLFLFFCFLFPFCFFFSFGKMEPGLNYTMRQCWSGPSGRCGLSGGWTGMNSQQNVLGIHKQWAELCMFARVLMRPCVYRSLRPARPHLARIVSPAQTVPSRETPVITEGSHHFCSCFCKELTRRHHAAAIRKSCQAQEPRYRG